VPESQNAFVPPDGCDYCQSTLGSTGETRVRNLHLAFYKFDGSQGHGGEGARDGAACDEGGEGERLGLRKDGSFEGFLGEAVLSPGVSLEFGWTVEGMQTHAEEQATRLYCRADKRCSDSSVQARNSICSP